MKSLFYKYTDGIHGILDPKYPCLDTKISLKAESVTEVPVYGHIGDLLGGHIGFHRKWFVSQVNQ